MREVHLLRSGPEGVSELTAYCTGIWDAATIERHASGSDVQPHERTSMSTSYDVRCSRVMTAGRVPGSSGWCSRTGAGWS